MLALILGHNRSYAFQKVVHCVTGITARLKRSKYRRELLNKFLAHAVL